MHAGHRAALGAIHRHLQHNPSIAKAKLAEERGTHEDTAFRHLSYFVDLGILAAVGATRDRVYRFAENRLKNMTLSKLEAEVAVTTRAPGRRRRRPFACPN